MEKTLGSLFCLLVLAGAAHADTVQLDETFEKTSKYLREHNLSLTGGPSGRDDLAAFGQEAILFYGEGVGNPAHVTPAQRGSMAKKAAETDAKRRVVEYLEGFALVGGTDVKDLMAVADVVQQRVSGVAKGVQLVVSEYNKEEDQAVAVVKIGLHGPSGFASALYEKLFSDAKAKKQITSDKPEFKITPVPLEEKYDGLIVDATGQDFRPALINRIFSSKGELLYDPAKISQKVLVEQGCGEYTNSVEKAKAALQARGVKNPLVIKASGAASRCDLQVSDGDAATIFSANQQGAFLAGAKVAFVLQ